MARDIEEFLRRAAERRQQQKQGSAPPPQPQQAPLSPVQNKPPRQQYAQPPSREEIVQDVEIVEEKKIAKKKKPKRESVSEHVEKHLDTSDIKQKTQKLGSNVAQVRGDFDKAVNEHLNNDICSVDENESSSRPKSQPTRPDPAARLREMLARPESIGQAILLAEILKPPSFED